MVSRTALVTGSAGGIGDAIARALQGAGLEVIGVDRQEHPHTGLAHYELVDLADPVACASLMARVGPVDVLVNNASVLVVRSLEEMELDDFDTLFDINLRAPVLLTRAALPGMIERGWGTNHQPVECGRPHGRGVAVCRLQHDQGRHRIVHSVRRTALRRTRHHLERDCPGRDRLRHDLTPEPRGHQRGCRPRCLPAGWPTLTKLQRRRCSLRARARPMLMA